MSDQVARTLNVGGVAVDKDVLGAFKLRMELAHNEGGSEADRNRVKWLCTRRFGNPNFFAAMREGNQARNSVAHGDRFTTNGQAEEEATKLLANGEFRARDRAMHKRITDAMTLFGKEE